MPLCSADRNLNSVSVESSVITPLPLRIFLRLGVVLWCHVLAIPTIVLAAEICSHESSQDERHAERADECEVSRSELWRVLWQEAVSSDRTTQVAKADVHGDTDTTLERATDVVTVPGDTHWDQGVNA